MSKSKPVSTGSGCRTSGRSKQNGGLSKQNKNSHAGSTCSSSGNPCSGDNAVKDLNFTEDMSPYEILQISAEASKEQIRAAYRKLALLSHPDKKENARSGAACACSSNDFVLLNRAYVKLMDSPPTNQNKDREIDTIISDVKENSCCIVIKILPLSVQAWIDALSTVYGPSKDQGNNGIKFSSIFVLDSEECEIVTATEPDIDNDEQFNLGTIFITVYDSKQPKLMIQGNSYLLWYIEHLPHLMKFLLEGTPVPSYLKTVHAVESVTSLKEDFCAATNVNDDTTVCMSCTLPSCDLPDNEDMIECSFCGFWAHYTCSEMTEEELQPFIDDEDLKYKCAKCREMPNDKTDCVDVIKTGADVIKGADANSSSTKEKTSAGVIKCVDVISSSPKEKIGADAIKCDEVNSSSLKEKTGADVIKCVDVIPSRTKKKVVEENLVNHTSTKDTIVVSQPVRCDLSCTDMKSNNVNQFNTILKRMDTLESHIVNALSESAKEAFLTKIDFLNEDLANANNMVKSLQASISKTDKAKSMSMASDTQIAKLKSNVSILRTEKDSLLSSNTRLSDEFKDNIHNLQVAHTSLNNIRSDLQLVRSELSDQRDLVHSKVEIIAQKNVELKCLKDNLDLAHSEIRELHRQLQSQADFNSNKFVECRSKKAKSDVIEHVGETLPTFSHTDDSCITNEVKSDVHVPVNVSKVNFNAKPVGVGELKSPANSTCHIQAPNKHQRPNQVSPPRNTPNRSQQGKKNPHLVVTSSLGRDLDYRRLRVDSSEVVMCPLSGARIEDIEKFIATDGVCKRPFSTITVLAGTNNIARKENSVTIAKKYESLISSVRLCHPEAFLHLQALPPRRDNNVCAEMVPVINNVLKEVCKKHNVYLIPCEVVDTNRSFNFGGLHLSPSGSAALATSIKKAFRLFSEFTRNTMDEECSPTPTHEECSPTPTHEECSPTPMQPAWGRPPSKSSSDDCENDTEKLIALFSTVMRKQR
jgi:hypothetical protein